MRVLIPGDVMKGTVLYPIVFSVAQTDLSIIALGNGFSGQYIHPSAQSMANVGLPLGDKNKYNNQRCINFF